MGASNTPAATILIVEPKVLARIVLADFLRGCGYRVVEAASGEEAKIILVDASMGIDVALIEVDLPGPFDGFTLARWIRNDKPSVRVQLVGTISKAASAAAELCEEGSVLPAPYTHQAVLDRIKYLLAAAERNGEGD